MNSTVNLMTEKWGLWVLWLKSWLKGAGKAAEVCIVHTILSQQSRHKEKKKAETCESPNMDAKHRNNPIQTHTKYPFGIRLFCWNLKHFVKSTVDKSKS